MASIKGNIFWNSIRVISNLIFPLITFPYASRILGPESIGLFNYVFAIATYFTLFASFGFSLYGTREIAVVRSDNRKLSDTTTSIITANLLITVFVCLCYVIFCIWIISENKILFIVTGFLIILTPLSLEWFYQGIEDFKYITLRGLVIKTISLICLFIFVKGPADLLVYAILSVSATCGNNLLNLIRLQKFIRIRLNFDHIGMHLKNASVFFLGNIAISFYSYMNDIIVGLMNNMEGVGYFSTGNKIIHLIIQVLGVITISIMPRMSSLIGQGSQERADMLLKKTLSLVMYLAFPITIGVFILSRPIVLLFAGVKFLPSVDVIKILSLLIIIISVSQFLGNQILIPNRKEKYGNYAVIIGAIVNIVSALLLVPKFSFYGVAISLLCAETTVTVFMFFFATKYSNLKNSSYLPTKSIISAILMGGVILWINSISDSLIFMILSIVIGCMVYVCSLYILNDQFAKNELILPIYRKLIHKL